MVTAGWKTKIRATSGASPHLFVRIEEALEPELVRESHLFHGVCDVRAGTEFCGHLLGQRCSIELWHALLHVLFVISHESAHTAVHTYTYLATDVQTLAYASNDHVWFELAHGLVFTLKVAAQNTIVIWPS